MRSTSSSDYLVFWHQLRLVRWTTVGGLLTYCILVEGCKLNVEGFRTQRVVARCHMGLGAPLRVDAALWEKWAIPGYSGIKPVREGETAVRPVGLADYEDEDDW